MSACKACGHEHKATIGCTIARRQREFAERQATPKVAEPEIVVANVVANAMTVVANRSGDRHKDKAKRNEYQRVLMAKRRATNQKTNP